MAFKRPGLEAHRERVDTVKSLYLKTADFEEQRRFRPLFWLYNGDVIDILFYQEGWHIPDEIDPKTKKPKFPKGKPVRFPASMKQEEFPQLEWKMESYGNEKPRPATPKSSASMLVWDYKSQDLKIVSFSQKTVLKALNEYVSPLNEDGSTNEAYIENLCSVDFIVKKIDDRTWNINTKEGNPKIPLEAWNALANFQFSWDKFMESDASMDDAPIMADFMDQVEGNVEVETKEEQSKRLEKTNAGKASSVASAAANKTISKPVSTQTASSDNENDWREVKTPKGNRVGDMSLETLQKTKNWFETEKKDSCQNSKLYNAIVAGIKAQEKPQTEDEPEEALEEDAPW